MHHSLSTRECPISLAQWRREIKTVWICGMCSTCPPFWLIHKCRQFVVCVTACHMVPTSSLTPAITRSWITYIAYRFQNFRSRCILFRDCTSFSYLAKTSIWSMPTLTAVLFYSVASYRTFRIVDWYRLMYLAIFSWKTPSQCNEKCQLIYPDRQQKMIGPSPKISQFLPHREHHTSALQRSIG